MSDLPNYNRFRTPLISILLTLLCVLAGFQIIGPIIGTMIAFPFFPGNTEEFSEAFKNPLNHPSFKSPLLIMQGCATLFGMIIIPAFLLRKQDRRLNSFFNGPVYTQPAFIVPVLVIVFMGFNSLIIQWNQGLTLPFGMDEWARNLEERLGEATEYITKFDSFGQFFLAFVVVAILPAFGEEIVFRGMIQNDLNRAFNNQHLAIWVSAILFSAIHLQFFGFFPRLLLGALFGYLYFWSGSLWLAILAHFVNNGFTIIALYLYQKGSFPVNIEDPEATVPWQAVIFSAVFCTLLLYAFKNFYNQHPKADIPD